MNVFLLLNKLHEKHAKFITDVTFRRQLLRSKQTQWVLLIVESKPLQTRVKAIYMIFLLSQIYLL